MTEKRCGLCRHWTRSKLQPDIGSCAADPDWRRLITGYNCGTVCPRFEPRLTEADIRERWPELWVAVEGWQRASERRTCIFTLGDGREISGKELTSRARAQLLEALGVEEE